MLDSDTHYTSTPLTLSPSGRRAAQGCDEARARFEQRNPLRSFEQWATEGKR
jgi:hypothetical protein